MVIYCRRERDRKEEKRMSEHDKERLCLKEFKREREYVRRRTK